MGKASGFLEYKRIESPERDIEERVKDFNEIHTGISSEEASCQGARCMNCGVPFCQSGMMIEGMFSGCPLNNLIPETNDLVYRGRWEAAYDRLSKTHPFPEFTSRVCPALCEKACTAGLYDGAVATKENERSIIENAFKNGLVKDEVVQRTGKTVAVIGSGPSGLSVARALNLRGHRVTVFERSRKPGGLLRYGIPNMKLDKRIIDRRVKILEEAGVEFKFNVNVGKDIKASDLLEKFDRVVLCTGASKPRDLNVPGRDSKGIYFAVDFLKEVTMVLEDKGFSSRETIDYTGYSFKSLQGRRVVIVGGGDTGNDCAATALRLGAKTVTQIEMMSEPPRERLSSNPWPEWPKVLKTDYGQEECIYLTGSDPRIYETTVSECIKNKRGHIKAVKTVRTERVKDHDGRFIMKNVPGTEKEIPCDILLIAAGFLGSEEYTREAFNVDIDNRTNFLTKDFLTSKDRVFACGDARRGQSLVVWAISEGKKAAREVDISLMGYSNL